MKTREHNWGRRLYLGEWRSIWDIAQAAKADYARAPHEYGLERFIGDWKSREGNPGFRVVHVPTGASSACQEHKEAEDNETEAWGGMPSAIESARGHALDQAFREIAGAEKTVLGATWPSKHSAVNRACIWFNLRHIPQGIYAAYMLGREQDLLGRYCSLWDSDDEKYHAAEERIKALEAALTRKRKALRLLTAKHAKALEHIKQASLRPAPPCTPGA
jgi:hypothetical protein